jgi:hypothetical protein
MWWHWSHLLPEDYVHFTFVVNASLEMAVNSFTPMVPTMRNKSVTEQPKKGNGKRDVRSVKESSKSGRRDKDSKQREVLSVKENSKSGRRDRETEKRGKLNAKLDRKNGRSARESKQKRTLSVKLNSKSGRSDRESKQKRKLSVKENRKSGRNVRESKRRRKLSVKLNSKSGSRESNDSKTREMLSARQNMKSVNVNTAFIKSDGLRAKQNVIEKKKSIEKDNVSGRRQNQSERSDIDKIKLISRIELQGGRKKGVQSLCSREEAFTLTQIEEYIKMYP